MIGSNRKPGTIRVGDPVMVIATGQTGRCTSRPGSKYFVNFGKEVKGEQFTREELKKLEKDESQIEMF